MFFSYRDNASSHSRSSWEPRRRRKQRSPWLFWPGLDRLEDRIVLSFFSPPTFAVGTSPDAQAVGNLNGDTHADLVVVNQGSNTVSVLLGNGDGTFQPRTDYATGTTPAGVALGDFFSDSKEDIAVVGTGSSKHQRAR